MRALAPLPLVVLLFAQAARAGEAISTSASDSDANAFMTGSPS